MDDDAAQRARFEQVAREVWSPLHAYVARRASRSDVDDIVNETLTTMWRRLDDVPEDATLPWAYAVARRTLSNHRRTERRRTGLFDRVVHRTRPADLATDSVAEHVDGDPDLAWALAQLPADDVELARLWAWEQLEPREIATRARDLAQHRQRPVESPSPPSARTSRNRVMIPSVPDTTPVPTKRSATDDEPARRSDPSPTHRSRPAAAAAVHPSGGTAGRAAGADHEHPHHHPSGVLRSSNTPSGRPNRGRRGWIFGGAGLGTAAAIAGIIALGGGSPSVSTLELDLGQDDIMASCLPVSADIVAGTDLAFAATVTSVDGETVTLDVTRWYAGGDADQVVLTAPAGMEALIGGIAFEQGGAYLVSATADGTVNYCGLTGPATPELQAVYDAAFPG